MEDIFNKKTSVKQEWLEGRNIYVFSDFHSGDGTARDNFKYLGNETNLMQCLKYIKKEDENSAILILGDFLEFWQSPFGSVFKNNISLMDEFADTEAVYILGNHDNDLLDFLDPKISPLLGHKFFDRMGEAVLINRGDKRIALAHGHEVDPFNSSAVPGKGRVLAIIAGMFEDKIGSPFLPNGKSVESSLLKVGEWLLSIGMQLYAKFKNISTPEQAESGQGLTASKSNDLTQKNIESWEKIKNEKKEFDVLVCGHTHRPGIAKNSENICWYYNSGSWASNRNTYLKIDLKGEITIHEWKDGGTILFDETITY